MTGQSLKLWKFITNQVVNTFGYAWWTSVISTPEESYISGNFNVNLGLGCKNIKSKFQISVSSNAWNYQQFCRMFVLKQVMYSSIRITCRSTFLIDHILASILSGISQHSVTNVNASYLQLGYCTRKTNWIKTKGIHLSFCSLIVGNYKKVYRR